MTAEQTETTRAHDALLDVVNEVSFHDRKEDQRSIQQHVGDILREEGFAVIDDSIVIDPEFQSASAEFIISGRKVKVSF